MGKKKKIVIPSEQEVAQYGGEPAPPADQPAESAETSAGAVPDQGVSGDVSSPEGDNPALQPEASEAEQWKEKFLRAKADLANYQKRAQKDQADALRYANANLVKALLPILDDLERVIESSTAETAELKSVVDGVRLTLENCLKVLRDFNVERIVAEGQPFDPEVHEAMMQQPSEDYSEPTVLQEFSRGYRLYERVLRPARVIVSKPVESAEPDSTDAADDQ